jgi:hypothetical protein
MYRIVDCDQPQEMVEERAPLLCQANRIVTDMSLLTMDLTMTFAGFSDF